MEIGTGLAILGAKDLIVKILGPTADLIGENLREYTERGARNLRIIFEKTAQRLGDEINKPGAVPPNILKIILNEGYYCEDELSAEYFAGILASSRSDKPRDDRGITYLSLVSQMSNYQKMSHYLMYGTLRSLYAGTHKVIGTREGNRSMATYAAFVDYENAMDFELKEYNNFIFHHSFNGLIRLNLIDNQHAFGPPDSIKQNSGYEVPASGFVYQPSALGVELFLWAHGLGKAPPSIFLDPSLILPKVAIQSTIPNSKAIEFESAGK